MRISRAEVFLADIPLRLTVRHALASRDDTRNVFVRLVDETGLEGWGEGVPREYVTGETPDGAFDHLARNLLPRLRGLTVQEAGTLPGQIERAIPLEEGAQSARCAAELALLDLAGRRFDRSAVSWFGGSRRSTVRYGLVIPVLSGAGTGALLSAARQYGIGHVKVKAEGEGIVAVVREGRKALGDQAGLCVDANGAWSLEQATDLCRRLEEFGVRWIEQPLPRGEEGQVALLASRTSIPLMADESLTTLTEARRLIADGGFRLFNIRLSKLGGMAPSLQVAAEAEAAGIGIQVGCQVGETAVLAAAGRLLASALPQCLAVEGSYGERLLKNDLAAEPFEFGPAGEAAVQGGSGLGLQVLRERLEPMVVRSEALDYA